MKETDELTLHVCLRHNPDGSWRLISIGQDPSGDAWPGDPARFGQAIARARLLGGISQEVLAYRAGVTAVTVRHVEGAMHTVSPKVRGWLIEALRLLGVREPEPVAPENHLRDCPGGELCGCDVPQILRKPIYAFAGTNAGVSGRVKAVVTRRGQRFYLIGNASLQFLLVANHCELLTEEQYSKPDED